MSRSSLSGSRSRASSASSTRSSQSYKLSLWNFSSSYRMPTREFAQPVYDSVEC